MKGEIKKRFLLRSEPENFFRIVWELDGKPSLIRIEAIRQYFRRPTKLETCHQFWVRYLPEKGCIIEDISKQETSVVIQDFDSAAQEKLSFGGLKVSNARWLKQQLETGDSCYYLYTPHYIDKDRAYLPLGNLSLPRNVMKVTFNNFYKPGLNVKTLEIEFSTWKELKDYNKTYKIEQTAEMIGLNKLPPGLRCEIFEDVTNNRRYLDYRLAATGGISLMPPPYTQDKDATSNIYRQRRDP